MGEDLKKELERHGRKKFSIKYLIIGLVVIICIAFLAINSGYFSSSKDKVEYVTKNIERGDLEVIVSATGNLEPTNSVEIGIEVSGTIKDIYVDYNDEVEVGQVLAILDTTKLQAQVDSSTAALAVSIANLKESEVNVKNKKLVYDRTKTMYEKSDGKYPSKNEYDDARLNYEAALASLEAAKAKVMQSESNLKTDNQNLEKASVKSSIKGVVLNKEVEIGQTLAASMSAPKLFVLAKDLTKMDLIVSIDEADVADIKSGLKVSFNVDAYPNRTFEGKIKQVRVSPITTNGVVTYETVVDVDNHELLLKPGMTANAKIITKQTMNQLLVPNSALRFKPKVIEETKSAPQFAGPPRRTTNNGAKSTEKRDFMSLYVLENGVLREAKIKVIDTDGKSSAIESKDVKEGDTVVISQRSANAK